MFRSAEGSHFQEMHVYVRDSRDPGTVVEFRLGRPLSAERLRMGPHGSVPFPLEKKRVKTRHARLDVFFLSPKKLYRQR